LLNNHFRIPGKLPKIEQLASY